MTIDQVLMLALQHHQAGRFADAEIIYRQIISHQPQNANALHLLGVLLNQTQRTDAAAVLLRQSVKLAPSEASFAADLALVLATQADGLVAMNKIDPAIDTYFEALSLRSDLHEAANSLGVLLQYKKRYDEAIVLHQQAITARPDFAEAHNNLGNALRMAGQWDQAVASYRRALELRPTFAEALNNLGNAFKEKCAWADAIDAYRRSLDLRPDSPPTLNNLGIALRNAGHLAQAIHCHERALALSPEDAQGENDLGNAYYDGGQWEPAIVHYRAALKLRPQYADAQNNLGNALYEMAQYHEALLCYEAARELQPDSPDARWNLALCRLLLGDWQNGWADYEARWQLDKFRPHVRDFNQPLWDGGDLSGRRILLHAEQGFGDTIHFIRYAPMVAARGGHLIVECQRELVSLIRMAGCAQQVVARGDALPVFDVHCPLLSLPGIFNTTIESIPASSPYLYPNAGQSAKWRKRLSSLGDGLKVGLVWAGKSAHQKDRDRSVSLRDLAPLAIPCITFISLQKGEPSSQPLDSPAGMKLIDWTDELNDFADTSALVDNLDLVITVDTAVAHLAGALGKTVWVLVQFSPDWRWLLDRDNTPWYPNMRLFRQSRPREWTDVIDRIARQLADRTTPT
jgi:tetratricopeptide (TPR) repeat protein